MKKSFALLSIILQFTVITLHAERIDMVKAGAFTDGKKLNTNLINTTINKLNANGGGTLFFPAGTYLTGAVKLKSNITIDLEAGATLLFSDNFEDYLPFVLMRQEGVLMNNFSPLIYAIDAENITIKGEGTINGQGKKWWEEAMRISADFNVNGKHELNKYQSIWEKANDLKALTDEFNEDRVVNNQKRFFRPPLFQPFRCKNIRVLGVKLINSPFWTVNPEFCENVTVDGVTIINPPSPNTDGINPESCRYVHISNCHISVGDDCITLKSGRDLQGRRLNAPEEDITITNCTMLSGHGGVVIGSEMSGSVRRVVISNCIFDGTDRGIRIKSTRGRGGVVEDIQVSNIVMRNIKEEAVILSLEYKKVAAEPFSDRTPVFRNIHISNMIVTGVKCPIRIVGLEESPVTDVSFTNINIKSTGESEFKYFKNIRMTDVYVNGAKIETPKTMDAQ
jgi:polygalacturonase